jgi:hypothetical protein
MTDAQIASAKAQARKIFADQGHYVKEEDYDPGQAPKEAIPRAVEFRVYEETDMLPRDHLVTIVLQRPDEPLPTGSLFDARKYYRCTWSPWTSKMQAEYEKSKLEVSES